METALVDFKRIGIASSLRRCQLFAGLSQGDLEEIAGVTATKSLKKGEYLFREDDPAPGFYVVQRGAVNVHRVNAAGREQIIQVFRDGDSFAEAAVAGDAGYPADARAVAPSQVLLIQKKGFLALVKRRPELALRMLGAMSGHLRMLVGQLEDLMLKDVETRLANWLVRRCPEPQGAEGGRPARIELAMTKRVLAAELGTVAETLSRTLAGFRERGLVSVKGRTITVLSPRALHALLRRNLGE